MTRFVWTIELRNAIALRCPKGAPRAHIGPREDGTGYVASILEPGLPSAGPFKERYQAAMWAAEYVKRELFPDAVIEAPLGRYCLPRPKAKPHVAPKPVPAAVPSTFIKPLTKEQRMGGR